jgi:cytochrome P450
LAVRRGDIESVSIMERALWSEGPPQDLFREMRERCPVHWTRGSEESPEEGGFWSVTTADDVAAVSRDWRTYSSERGGVLPAAIGVPIETAGAMLIGMDPPRHDRLKALFQHGFTPKRIATQEVSIRTIVTRVLDRLEGREKCDLVKDVAEPMASRVIHRFMGIPEDDDRIWARLSNGILGAADSDINPGASEKALEMDLLEVMQRCGALIADRRVNPANDLTSVLVHADLDGEKLEEYEIGMGLFVLIAAGNDSTKATFCSGMRALMEHPEQMRMVLGDRSLIPGVVEESLRMYPAFTHSRRTATYDADLHGQRIRAGDSVVMWYVSSNRDRSHFTDPERFDITRHCTHQAFGAGGRHTCLGQALARLELNLMFEETLVRYPHIAIDGRPQHVESMFINQLKTLPVRLVPPG